MASFTRFESFSQKLAEKEVNCNTDTFKIYLSNTAPNVATHTVKADIAEISAGNGYTAGDEDTQNATSRSGAVTSVTGVDVVWTSSGAGFGPFRYVILYDDTHASDALIGYWDYTSSITPANGETFTTDFGSSMFTVG